MKNWQGKKQLINKRLNQALSARVPLGYVHGIIPSQYDLLISASKTHTPLNLNTQDTPNKNLNKNKQPTKFTYQFTVLNLHNRLVVRALS